MSGKAGLWLLAAVVAGLALTAGLYSGRRDLGSDDARARSALEAVALRDEAGRHVSLAAFRGKVVVLNFWATWCPPCREETPALVRAQSALGTDHVQIVGMAIDAASKVAAFRQELGVTYPMVVLGGEGIELMRTLGNRSGALPFTIVLDAEGAVRSRHLGALDQGSVERMAREAMQAR